jgi:predicted GIY-YIG superfamily endonuclease
VKGIYHSPGRDKHFLKSKTRKEDMKKEAISDKPVNDIGNADDEEDDHNDTFFLTETIEKETLHRREDKLQQPVLNVKLNLPFCELEPSGVAQKDIDKPICSARTRRHLIEALEKDAQIERSFMNNDQKNELKIHDKIEQAKIRKTFKKTTRNESSVRNKNASKPYVSKKFVRNNSESLEEKIGVHREVKISSSHLNASRNKALRKENSMKTKEFKQKERLARITSNKYLVKKIPCVGPSSVAQLAKTQNKKSDLIVKCGERAANLRRSNSAMNINNNRQMFHNKGASNMLTSKSAGRIERMKGTIEASGNIATENVESDIKQVDEAMNESKLSPTKKKKSNRAILLPIAPSKKLFGKNEGKVTAFYENILNKEQALVRENTQNMTLGAYEKAGRLPTDKGRLGTWKRIPSRERINTHLSNQPSDISSAGSSSHNNESTSSKLSVNDKENLTAMFHMHAKKLSDHLSVASNYSAKYKRLQEFDDYTLTNRTLSTSRDSDTNQKANVDNVERENTSNSVSYNEDFPSIDSSNNVNDETKTVV